MAKQKRTYKDNKCGSYAGYLVATQLQPYLSYLGLNFTKYMTPERWRMTLREVEAELEAEVAAVEAGRAQ